MQRAANEFSQDAGDSTKRSAMTDASKGLLMSVTRLMVVADMVDVSKLLEASSRVRVIILCTLVLSACAYQDKLCLNLRHA